ncbi:MAG: hypothetical protein GX495_13050 [Chloroflexi bacterium]|jgi:hypothetical protein|nr:hypothetical protein [Chloroflexota bacterium]
MQIYFERSGGFAAIRLAVDLDSEDLSVEEARKLREEIEEAGFFHLPAVISAPQAAGADRFQYRLRIKDGDREHSLEVNEAGMPDSLRPLIEHLTLLARSRRG